MSKPPAGVLLAYRFFGWRLGPDHADWVVDDITQPGWLLRQGAPAIAAVLLTGAVIIGIVGGDAGRLATLVFVLAAVGAFLRASLRERALRQQGIDLTGAPLEGATWYADHTARLRRNVIGTISTVVLVVAGMTLLALRTR